MRFPVRPMLVLALLAVAAGQAVSAEPAPERAAQGKQLATCSWFTVQAVKIEKDPEASAVYQALADILDSRAAAMGVTDQMRNEWNAELERSFKETSGNDKALEERFGKDMKNCNRLRREFGAEAEARGRKTAAAGKAGR